MGDNVKRIEGYAFYWCLALRFIRLSKALEYIGVGAFFGCRSLEALFLPSTVTSIEHRAFVLCRSMRVLILPNDIDLNKVGNGIIYDTAVYQIAEASGVEYDYDHDDEVTDESVRQVNEWLVIQHMDEAPFHKICYNSSISTKQLNVYLQEHGNDAALAIDPYYGMTPLHMLSMNPYAPADAVAALLEVNVETAFSLDNEGKIPLDYARDYNVGGLVAMISALCNHRNSASRAQVGWTDSHQFISSLKRRRIE